MLVRSGVPWRTRLSLVATAVRRRVRPAQAYDVRLGAGRVPISHADYGVDWETMRTIVVDRAYELDYADSVVVDIGAHKGCYGAFALEHGARAVVSYEPEETNFGYLARCAASYRGRGRDWIVRRAAVGGSSGTADLHVMGASWGHALVPSASAREDELAVQRVEVLGVADVLDDAVEIAGTSPLVVKVNAEGAECEIVMGSPLSAWERVDTLLVEVHSWAPCTLDDLVTHLAAVGFVLEPAVHVDWVHRLSRRPRHA